MRLLTLITLTALSWGCAGAKDRADDGSIDVVEAPTPVTGSDQLGLSPGGGSVNSPRFSARVAVGVPFTTHTTTSPRHEMTVGIDDRSFE